MKTGIIRRIDDLGRIVIPKEIRRKLNITEGDPLELSLDGNKIIFELYYPTYDHEEHIKRLIKAIAEDEFLFDTNKQLAEARRKAISALEEAYNTLHEAAEGGHE